MHFTQGLHRALRQRPHDIATVCQGRERSFAELAERVARLAGGLAALGVGQGERVAIYALNSDRYLEHYLAAAWLGAVVNPINFRWSTAEVAYALQDSGSRRLVVDDTFAAQAPALRAQVGALDTLIHAGDGPTPEGMLSHEALISASAPVPDREIGGDALFGVFYTGGTTGAPKGVLLSHRAIGLSALALMAEGGVPDGAVGLHAAPMFHLADMMLITMLLLRGGRHVMLPAFRPDALLGLVREQQLTDLLLVPAMLQAVVDHPDLAAHDLSSLRRIFYGASPASEALLDRTRERLPGVELMQVYGMTESAAVITVLPFNAHHAEAPRERLRSGGRAALHTRVRIVDAQGRDCPPGEVGEIVVQSPSLMQGYLNKPEATAAALREDGLHTGDLGRMDADGYVYIVDRLKDMIISGGENVYSAEVENVIAKHPAVAACAVIGVPSAEWGEAVHAAVVLKPGATLTFEELVSHCRTHIAGYKCPRSLEIRETLPLSGAGKVLKTELRKPHWEGRARAVN